MKRRAMIRIGLAVTVFISLAWAGTAMGLDGADIPPAGLYWRLPIPDALGNLTYSVGASVRLHAAPVELARVGRVVYLAGGSVIGQVTNPPYAFDWTAAGSGAVTLRAEARDGAGTVQGWCERTVQVIGDGLRVAQSAIAITVATGGSTSVTLDLTNLGPGDTEWAIHIQGGIAPGGTNGNIVRTFTNANPGERDSAIYRMTYRHRGTATTDDDEIWFQDPLITSIYDIHRRSATDWSYLGLFTGQWPFGITYEFSFAADGDGLWWYYWDSTLLSAGLAFLDPATGVEQRHIYLPQNSPWKSFGSVTPVSGAFYSSYASKNGVQVSEHSVIQFRERDGMVIADHGSLSSWQRLGSPSNYRLQSRPCWAHGHLWLIDGSSAPDTIDIYRWHPGMTEPVKTVSTPATYPDRSRQVVCGAGEPGFLWVADCAFDGSVSTTLMNLVDTGLRPWLRLADQRGTLANGAGHTVSVTIDAMTAPTGTYQAVLAITQYPNSLIPQILVPVTLTVTSGGMSAYEQWKQTYFTPAQLLDPSISGDAVDPDHDGMTNQQEYQAGTNPTNTASVLAMTGATAAGGELTISWSSVATKTYGIQKSTNLMQGFTMIEAANIPADPPTNSHPVTLGTGGSGFYRVKLE